MGLDPLVGMGVSALGTGLGALLGGQNSYNPLVDYANYAAMYAKQYTAEANNALTSGQNNALNYLGNNYTLAQGQLQPVSNQTYAALDNYAQLLGLDTPRAGSSAVYGAYNEYMKASQQYNTDYQKALGEYNNNKKYFSDQVASAQERGKRGETGAWQGHLDRLNAEWAKRNAEGGDLYKMKSDLKALEEKYTGMAGDKVSSDPMERLMNTPGYKFALQQGLAGIDQGAAARGQLMSGSTYRDEVAFASGLASQTYNTAIAQAQQALASTMPATQQVSQNYANQGQIGAGIYTGTASQVGNNLQALGSTMAGLNFNVGAALFGAQQSMQAMGAANNNINNGAAAYNKGLGL